MHCAIVCHSVLQAKINIQVSTTCFSDFEVEWRSGSLFCLAGQDYGRRRWSTPLCLFFLFNFITCALIFIHSCKVNSKFVQGIPPPKERIFFCVGMSPLGIEHWVPNP